MTTKRENNRRPCGGKRSIRRSPKDCGSTLGDGQGDEGDQPQGSSKGHSVFERLPRNQVAKRNGSPEYSQGL